MPKAINRNWLVCKLHRIGTLWVLSLYIQHFWTLWYYWSWFGYCNYSKRGKALEYITMWSVLTDLNAICILNILAFTKQKKSAPFSKMYLSKMFLNEWILKPRSDWGYLHKKWWILLATCFGSADWPLHLPLSSILWSLSASSLCQFPCPPASTSVTVLWQQKASRRSHK